MDTEAVVARRLAKSTGLTARLEVPSDNSGEFITVELTGEGSGFVAPATLAVQTWADTRKRAREMMQAVVAAVPDLEDEDNIFHPVAESTYRFPDPDTRRARYQTTVSLNICE